MQTQHHKRPIINIIGWLGTIILLSSYALNSFGFIPSTGLIYGVSNIIVALLLGIRVSVDKNWSNLTLQIIFGLIAVINVIHFFIQ